MILGQTSPRAHLSYMNRMSLIKLMLIQYTKLLILGQTYPRVHLRYLYRINLIQHLTVYSNKLTQHIKIRE